MSVMPHREDGPAGTPPTVAIPRSTPLFCGKCGAVIDPPMSTEDTPAVQELTRMAFAERELAAVVAVVAVVQEETEAEAAARRLQEYHAELQWLHLPTVQTAFAAVVGLVPSDPRVLAVPWVVSASNRVDDRDDESAPVLFLAAMNGVRLQAIVQRGKASFAGRPGNGREVPITDLASLGAALDRRSTGA